MRGLSPNLRPVLELSIMVPLTRRSCLKFAYHSNFLGLHGDRYDVFHCNPFLKPELRVAAERWLCGVGFHSWPSCRTQLQRLPRSLRTALRSDYRKGAHAAISADRAELMGVRNRKEENCCKFVVVSTYVLMLVLKRGVVHLT